MYSHAKGLNSNRCSQTMENCQQNVSVGICSRNTSVMKKIFRNIITRGVSIMLLISFCPVRLQICGNGDKRSFIHSFIHSYIQYQNLTSEFYIKNIQYNDNVLLLQWVLDKYKYKYMDILISSQMYVYSTKKGSERSLLMITYS